MGKFFFLIFVVLLVQNCAIRSNLENSINSKQDVVNHDFVTGQWVETNDLNRLKERDLTAPHPFNVNVVSHLTCIKEGQLLYDNWGTIYASVEKKNDYYEYVNEDHKLKLRFNVMENDTMMSLWSKFRSDDPQQILLTKVPTARSCDFEVTPDEGITSGIRVAYNYYYFKGKYSVKDIVNNSTMDVEISFDNRISGLKAYDAYALYTFGFNIRVHLFKIQKHYRAAGVRNIQECRLVGKDYGFDLYAVPKASYIKKLEKLYEFRRR